MSNQRVLVVDDDEKIRFTMQRILTAEGLDVSTASDGAEGLIVFEQVRPDLVLLDVSMPRLNGFEVCERLKGDAETRLVPVVIVTSGADLDNRVRGIDAGADDFLSKPFERVELIARVRSLLRLKRYTDELERAEAVLLALARAIEGKDPYTEGYCERALRAVVRACPDAGRAAGPARRGSDGAAARRRGARHR